ncbi:hypothetical protein ACOME3_002618 [Neoechinorhynchus agilis]
MGGAGGDIKGRTLGTPKNNLSKDMISLPNGNVVHTLHVGVTGDTFGDLSHLGGTMLASIKDCRNDSMRVKSKRESLAGKISPSFCSSTDKNNSICSMEDSFIDFGPSFYDEVMRALDERLSSRSTSRNRNSMINSNPIDYSNESMSESSYSCNSAPLTRSIITSQANSFIGKELEDDDFSEGSDDLAHKTKTASVRILPTSCSQQHTKKKLSLTPKWLRSNKHTLSPHINTTPTSISSPVRLLKDTRIIKAASVDLRSQSSSSMSDEMTTSVTAGFPPLPDLTSLGAKLTLADTMSASGAIRKENCYRQKY